MHYCIVYKKTNPNLVIAILLFAGVFLFSAISYHLSCCSPSWTSLRKLFLVCVCSAFLVFDWEFDYSYVEFQSCFVTFLRGPWVHMRKISERSPTVTGTLEIVSLELIEQYPSLGTIGVKFIQDPENQLRIVMLLAQPGLCLSSYHNFCFRLSMARPQVFTEIIALKKRWYPYSFCIKLIEVNIVDDLMYYLKYRLSFNCKLFIYFGLIFSWKVMKQRKFQSLEGMMKW